MRRIAGIGAAIVAAAALAGFGTAAGGDSDDYLVRAIFDNGGFLVPGEEVRIAGAKVGSVDSVDVTGVDEAVHANGSPEPGKAVVVLRIDDPGFQDFRQDASCLIRPQSLLGERFVECQQTQPHAPSTEPPPPLEEIGESEPGEGQRLLPLEQNGKAIDLDLVNDIMREPYPDRFRLILNDLGAGLAARGEDLKAVLERANPALRRTDEVLAILAKQNRQLASLARDGDEALAPLARERQHIGNFINSATTTAQATAERGADLEASFQKLPGFLRELRATMTELDSFSTSATPVVADLRAAAPDLTRINLALAPFADAGTRSLRSLGNAAEEATPDLVASEPVLGDLEGLARKTRPVAGNLSKLLSSLRQTGAFRYLTQLIFNTTGSVNAFDSYGHFLRTLLPLNNCVDYSPTQFGGGGFVCDAHWTGSASKLRAAAKAGYPELLGRLRGDEKDAVATDQEARSPELGQDEGVEDSDRAVGGSVAPEGEGEADDPVSMRQSRMMLDYFLGEPAEGKRGAR